MNNVKLFLNEMIRYHHFFYQVSIEKYRADSESKVIRLDIQTIFIKLQPVN